MLIRARKIASPTSRAIVFSSRATKIVSPPCPMGFTSNTGLPRNVPSKLRARSRTLHIQPGRAEEKCAAHTQKFVGKAILIECQ